MKMLARKSQMLAAFAGAAALFAAGETAAGAQTILDKWSSVAIPPPPTLEKAEVDVKTTALLILDMYPTSCKESERPSCVPTIPRIKTLLDAARARKMTVVYSAGPASANGPTVAVAPIAALPDEPTVRAPADKFIGSGLDKLLADKGIQTVIIVGTSADAAVLYTASHAALLGLKAVVPIDAISSKAPFSELYTVYHLKNTATTVTKNVTLTRTDMITLK
jgi:nicotinamidase-related amidase